MSGSVGIDAATLETVALERAALAALPAATIDPSRLRPLTRRDLAGIFSSPAIGREWPAVEQAIEDLVVIEDMKTGGVNPGDRRALYYLVRALCPQNILEIGTNVGASTIHMAAALQRNAAETGSDGTLVTVDVEDVNAAQAFWSRASLPRPPRDTIGRMGLADCVAFVTMDSVAYLQSNRRQFDLIFLDGDHAAVTVYRELPYALQCLRAGGTIVLHDVFPHHRPLWGDMPITPGPLLTLERFQGEGARIELIPLGALPWPTKLGTSVTSLAVVTRQ